MANRAITFVGSGLLRLVTIFAMGASSLALDAESATVTVSGASSVSSCTYTSMSEDGSGNWAVTCGAGSKTVTFTPTLNGTVCTLYSSISEDASGNWAVAGCQAAAPTVALDQPAQSGQTYPTETPYSLKATASAPSGRTLSSVAFFANGVLIHAGTLSGSQYVWDWSPGAGTFVVFARATDNTGAITDSVSRQMIFQPSFGQANIFYIHPDNVGTPRQITRATDNQLVWKWENSEAFGVGAPQENPSGLGSFTYNLRFPGQYYDVETGTHYNYKRDYDPRIGRYLQSDPLGLHQSPAGEIDEINTYAYAIDSPLGYSDPTGEWIGAIGRGAAYAMAVCMRNKRCRDAIERAGKFCKNLECKFERHAAHHYFPGLGYCEHYSLTCVEKGVGPVFRDQWPLPGRCVATRPGGPLPDHLPPKPPQEASGAD